MAPGHVLEEAPLDKSRQLDKARTGDRSRGPYVEVPS